MAEFSCIDSNSKVKSESMKCRNCFDKRNGKRLKYKNATIFTAKELQKISSSDQRTVLKTSF